MGLTHLPALDVIKSRMAWLSSRHSVIADNIAQAARPGFIPRDLAPMVGRDQSLPLASTQGATLQGTGKAHGFATISRGAPLSLETEAAALAETSLDYQLAATLYGRSFRLLKTAIGKR